MESNYTTFLQQRILQASIVPHTIGITEYLSYTFGVLYLAFWGFSFFPQIWESYKRQKTDGIAYEFAFLQPIAYFFYCVYTYVGRVELTVDNLDVIDLSLYEQIDKADIYFATQAFLMSCAILTQSLIYPRGSIGDQKQLKRWSLNLFFIVGGLVLLSFAVEISIDESNQNSVLKRRYEIIQLPKLLQTNMFCGYAMLICHVAKYLPQFQRNQERKSTVGLSKNFVICDLLGSLFALLQHFMDIFTQSELQTQYQSFANTLNNLNMIKLYMTIVSIVFDFVFIIQRSCVYTDAVKQDQKKKIFNQNTERRQVVSFIIDEKLKKMPIIIGDNEEKAIEEKVELVEQYPRQSHYQLQQQYYPQQQYDQDIELLDQSLQKGNQPRNPLPPYYDHYINEHLK